MRMRSQWVCLLSKNKSVKMFYQTWKIKKYSQQILLRCSKKCITDSINETIITILSQPFDAEVVSMIKLLPSDECTTLCLSQIESVLIIMNSWIERNIIFPRLNQLKRKEEQQRVELIAKVAVLKQLVQRKNSSEHKLEESGPFARSQNQSLEARKLILSVKRKKYLNPSIRTEEAQDMQYFKISERAKRHALDAELLYDRKNMFHSSPLKNVVKKMNSGREGYRKVDIMEECNPVNKLIKHQRQRTKQKIAKFKTNPSQHFIQKPSLERYEIDCLNIKKAPTFQYNLSMKNQETQRSSKRRRYQKVKSFNPFKQSGFKITSVKGWKHQQEELMQFL